MLCNMYKFNKAFIIYLKIDKKKNVFTNYVYTA